MSKIAKLKDLMNCDLCVTNVSASSRRAIINQIAGDRCWTAGFRKTSLPGHNVLYSGYTTFRSDGTLRIYSINRHRRVVSVDPVTKQRNVLHPAGWTGYYVDIRLDMANNLKIYQGSRTFTVTYQLVV